MDNSFLRDINILYVEDEDDVRSLTVGILSKFVKNVVEAANGKEGFEKFKEYNANENSEFKIDLVVTDINMPKMNGLDMIEAIEEIDYNIPCIITTAHNDADFLRKAINQRVRGYVNKPLKMDRLIETMALAVEPKYLKDKLEELNRKLSYEVEEKTLELKSILDSQENMILVLDEDKISSANKTFLDFFSISSIDELLEDSGCVSKYFIESDDSFVSSENQQWILDIMKLEDMKRVVTMKNPQSEDRIFRVDIKSFFYHTKHYVVSFTDITQLQEYTYELQYRATHDNLTKLYNRQKLNDELSKEILRETRYQHKLSLMMFDIDDFKNINDTYGHDVGDVVLEDMARILKHSIRVTDIASRWGGEEFMVLLPETSLEDCSHIAEHLRKNIEDYTLKGIEHPITISIGIAEFKVGIDDKDSFTKNVDIALYDAKKSGKNRVVKYEK